MRLLSLLLALAFTAPAEASRQLVVVDDAHEPLTLDPHEEFTEKEHAIVLQIYEGLARFADDGRIEPSLAESWERMGPRRVRFKLRPGVSFHDGSPLDAEAVRFSIERILDPATAFPGRAFLGPIEGAEVVDPLTVDVLTREPDGLLLHRLAAFALVVPPSRFAEGGDGKAEREPAGTGPFRFVHWKRGEEVRLEAFPDYWGGEPAIHGVTFRFFDEARALDALLSGKVDVVTNVPGTRTMEVQSHPEAKVVKGRTFFTVFAAMDLSRPPFSDPRVRRAVNLAVDRKSWVRYDILGNGAPLATLSMPGEEGHDPSLKPYPYDPSRARELLAEAGYPEGFEIRAIVNSHAERSAKILGVELEKVGVRVLPAVTPHAKLIERFKDPRFKMSIGGVNDPMAHSYFVLSVSLYSKSPFSMGRDAEFDALLEKMAATTESAARKELGRRLDRLVHEKALALFGYQRIQTHAVREGVVLPTHVTGFLHFRGAAIEDAKGRGVARQAR